MVTVVEVVHGLRLRGLKQDAAALQALVNEEGQHHQGGEHRLRCRAP